MKGIYKDIHSKCFFADLKSLLPCLNNERLQVKAYGKIHEMSGRIAAISKCAENDDEAKFDKICR